MKNLFVLFLLALAIFYLSGCADNSTPSSTASSSDAAVAGEKTSGMEDRVGAGVNGMSPSAQVKW